MRVRRRHAQLGFEPLEGRVVLDAAAARGLGAAVALVDGTLTVNGTDGPDRISVGVGRRGQIRVGFNGESGLYPGVDRIAVLGNRGADRIQVGPRVRVPTAVDGGIGPDRIVATGSSADVSGGAGDDVLVGGGGRPTLDGDTGAGRVVFAGSLGTLRVAAGAGGEALALLGLGYRLAPLQAGAAGSAGSGAGSAPILVGPTDLSVTTKVAAIRAAYAAGGTVAITDATAAQAQQLATLVGHGGSIRLGDGQPLASLVALRRVSRGGGSSQYETTVTYPSQAPAGPRGRSASRHQLEALTAVFAATPSFAAPAAAAASDPGNLLALANSYLYRASVVGPTRDFVQNVTTVYGVRSFQNQSDFFYVFQETDLVANSVQDATNTAFVYMAFETSPRPPGLLQPTPETTLASRSVTSGVSYNIGGSVGFNQSQGFNASVSGGVTISNSTTTVYPPIDIANLSNNQAYGVGNPAWNFAVNSSAAPGTAGTTVTAVDNFIWQVPFSLYERGQTQFAFDVQVDYSTSSNPSTTLPLDVVVDTPFGDVYALKTPVVASVDRPTVSPGQVFTIQGTGFYPSLVTNVLVGGTPATFQPISDTAITVVAAGQPGDNLPVVVLTSQGVSNDNVTVNIALPPPPIPTTTIAGNLGQTIYDSGAATGVLLGGQFTVAPGTIWGLDSATLLLDPGGSPLNSVVSLYSDNGNNRPGNLLATLGTLQAAAYSLYLPQTVTVAPGSPTIPLYGGTTYWLVASTGPNGLTWASTPTETTGPLGSVDSRGIAFDPDGTPVYSSSYAYQFDVKGRKIAGT